MEKYIYNEQNGPWYESQGDYYIPCLVLPTEKEERHIGVWGRRHLQYIRQYKKVFYTNLLASGKLQSYLADIEEQAEERILLPTKQMAEREGVAEHLKAEDQMLWVQRMNNIRANATEIVNHELIYT